MNILILSWRSPSHPNAGGAEKVTLQHAKAWVKAGHKVVWFSSFFTGAKKQEIKNGVTIIRKGNYFLGVRWDAFLWYTFGKHYKFDLVIDEFHGIPFFAPLYIRTKVLAFIHEVAKEVWTLNPWPKPYNIIPATIGRVGEPLIFKLLYRKSVLPGTKDIPFMTVSESTKDDLVKWGIKNRNIHIIPNGIEKGLDKYIKEKEKKSTAIFLGAASEDKGVFDAIRAFSDIYKKDKGWQFWIVGDATEEIMSRMKKLSKSMGINKRIEFFGYVSDKKKFELLSRAHVLINPSVREGWGLVNIEASAMGTPVVGYNVAGVRDSVKNGKTGLLCDYGDYEVLAERVIQLVSDNNLYKKYQKESIKWSKKFTWSNSVRQSLKLIGEI